MIVIRCREQALVQQVRQRNLHLIVLLQFVHSSHEFIALILINSTEADDYSKNTLSYARRKTLLVNSVIVGRTCNMRYNARHLQQPPRGFDSVTGTPGGDLNYEETVVYENDAIRPAFLIVYG